MHSPDRDSGLYAATQTYAEPIMVQMRARDGWPVFIGEPPAKRARSCTSCDSTSNSGDIQHTTPSPTNTDSTQLLDEGSDQGWLLEQDVEQTIGDLGLEPHGEMWSSILDCAPHCASNSSNDMQDHLQAPPENPSGFILEHDTAFKPSNSTTASQPQPGRRAPSRSVHSRKEWTSWEDDSIRIGVQDLGTRWRAIAARLPGRSGSPKHILACAYLQDTLCCSSNMSAPETIAPWELELQWVRMHAACLGACLSCDLTHFSFWTESLRPYQGITTPQNIDIGDLGYSGTGCYSGER